MDSIWIQNGFNMELYLRRINDVIRELPMGEGDYKSKNDFNIQSTI